MDGLTTVAFFMSLGAVAKSGMVSGGIDSDEKPAALLILLLTAGLIASSLTVNLKKGRRSCVMFNLLSLLMLAAAITLAASGWR